MGFEKQLKIKKKNMTINEQDDFVVGAWLLIVLGVILLFCAFAFAFAVLFLVIAGIICIALGWAMLYFVKLERKKETKRRRIIIEQTIADLHNAVEPHRHALRRNLDRALIMNDYGAIAQDNQGEVIKEFMGSVGLDWDVIGVTIAKEIIFEELEFHEKYDRESGFDPATIPTDGFEFEHWVAENLNQFGWDAKATSGSGDQGIDVIAKKNGKTVGLQCKLFSSPVGNKAVQEAHAGKTFHQMDVVGVMSNASYTKSAKALATDTGVKLLSHHDIPNLYDKMFSE